MSDLKANQINQKAEQANAPLRLDDITEAGVSLRQFQHITDEQIKRVNYARGGKSEEIGIMPLSIDQNVIEKIKNGEKGDKTFEFIKLQQDLDDWLDKYQKALDQRLREVERKLSIMKEIERLHKSGEFDLSSPEHLALLNAVDIATEDFKANGDSAIAEGKKRISIEKDQILKEQQKASEWEKRRAQGDPTVDEEIEEQANSYEGQRVAHLSLANAGEEETRERAENLGFDERESNIISSARVDSDNVSFDDDFSSGEITNSFSNEPISAANVVSETSIKAENISPKFANAASPDQPTTPDPDLVVTPKTTVDLTNSF